MNRKKWGLYQVLWHFSSNKIPKSELIDLACERIIYTTDHVSAGNLKKWNKKEKKKKEKRNGIVNRMIHRS